MYAWSEIVTNRQATHARSGIPFLEPRRLQHIHRRADSHQLRHQDLPPGLQPLGELELWVWYQH